MSGNSDMMPQMLHGSRCDLLLEPMALVPLPKAIAVWKDDSAEAMDLWHVRRCLEGDGESFRPLIEKHQARIAAMMWRFSRDPETHEDLVQEVFVEAYANLAKYRAEAPFAHWLAGIATHIGYQFWKRERRERALRVDPLEDWHTVMVEPAESREPSEAGELLFKLLASLPPRDRLVLTLRCIENHSLEKTAELTGWSVPMVKVQAMRARSKLKKLFEKAAREVNP